MSVRKKLVIIGAGTAGICAAKHSIQQGFDVTVFEQGAQVGGTWNYTDQVEENEYGLDVHSSMYKGLITNLQKEVMGFPDYPINVSEEKSYIRSEEVLEFLKSYAKFFKLNNFINFNHHVIRVTPAVKNTKWEVIVKNLITCRYETFSYDFILICTGHHSVPSTPKYSGLQSYQGTCFHSHDYKDAELYRDKTVLVVGAGFSGLDIALQLSTASKTVTLSHHLKNERKTIIPSFILQTSDIARFLDNEILFTDGHIEKFDIVIFCTGFKYTFPFLSTDCGIFIEDNFYIRPLYKHIVNINNPTMAFIGIPDIAAVAQMCDLQVRFILKFFTNEKQLPTKDEMLKQTDEEMEERWRKGYKKHRAHMMDTAQENYFLDISNIANIESVSSICVKLYDENRKRVVEDLANYRNYGYKIVDEENEHFVRFELKK